MDQATAQEELASIRALMAESQGLLSGTWPHQLVWGAAGALGLVATWWGVWRGAFDYALWVWAAVLAVGWTFSLREGRRGRTRGRVRNVATRAFSGIWLGLGVTLTLLAAVALLTGAIDPRTLPGSIALILGAGYFASGFLSGLRWLSGVAVAWWVGGLGLLLWRGPEILLALAVMAVVLEVGPALVLRRMDRAQGIRGP